MPSASTTTGQAALASTACTVANVPALPAQAAANQAGIAAGKPRQNFRNGALCQHAALREKRGTPSARAASPATIGYTGSGTPTKIKPAPDRAAPMAASARSARIADGPAQQQNAVNRPPNASRAPAAGASRQKPLRVHDRKLSRHFSFPICAMRPFSAMIIMYRKKIVKSPAVSLATFEKYVRILTILKKNCDRAAGCKMWAQRGVRCCEHSPPRRQLQAFPRELPAERPAGACAPLAVRAGRSVIRFECAVSGEWRVVPRKFCLSSLWTEDFFFSATFHCKKESQHETAGKIRGERHWLTRSGGDMSARWKMPCACAFLAKKGELTAVLKSDGQAVCRGAPRHGQMANAVRAKPSRKGFWKKRRTALDAAALEKSSRPRPWTSPSPAKPVAWATGTR